MTWATATELVDYCKATLGLERIFPEGVYPGEFDANVRQVIEKLHGSEPQYNIFDIERMIVEIDGHVAQASLYKRQYLDIEAEALRFALDRAVQHGTHAIEKRLASDANAIVELKMRAEAYMAAANAFPAGSGHDTLYAELAKVARTEEQIERDRVALHIERLDIAEQSFESIADVHTRRNGPTDYASRLMRAWQYFEWEIRHAYIKSISLWMGMAEVFGINDYAVAPDPNISSWFDAFVTFFREIKETHRTRTKNEIEYVVPVSLVENFRMNTGQPWSVVFESLSDGGAMELTMTSSSARVTGLALAFVQPGRDPLESLPAETANVADRSTIRAAAEARAARNLERRQREISIDVTAPVWLPRVVPSNDDPSGRHLRPVLQGQERIVRPVIPNIPARPLNSPGVSFFAGQPIHNVPLKGTWRLSIPEKSNSPIAEDTIFFKDDNTWKSTISDIIVYFRVRSRTRKSEDASLDIF